MSLCLLCSSWEFHKRANIKKALSMEVSDAKDSVVKHVSLRAKSVDEGPKNNKRNRLSGSISGSMDSRESRDHQDGHKDQPDILDAVTDQIQRGS